MKWTQIPGLAALAAVVASPAVAGPQVYSYAITHPIYGAIGVYDRSSADDDGTTRAEAHLRIVVRVLGVPVRRETATQSEVWRGHRLVSFRSLTSTDGRRTAVSGEASGNRFLVTSPSGVATAPADVVASDPFSLSRMGPGTVVSIRTGKISSVEVTGGETETLTLHGAPQAVRHFHVNTATQPNKWEVWIDRQGTPIKFRSIESAGAIDFTLVSPLPPTGEAAGASAAGRAN